MAPTLYSFPASPCVRAVIITAEAIGLELNHYNVDLMNGEHLSEKFLKINPLHTVPTLDDNGNILRDSHIINAYIIEKYTKNKSLYPEDHYERALVQQGLAFDCCYLYPILRDIDVAYYKKEITCLTPSMIEKTIAVYDLVETLLKKTNFIAIDHVTLADISCYTTITSLDYHIPITPEKYPKISNWIKVCAKMPMFEGDTKNLKSFHDLMKRVGAKPHHL
ncbi:hypothetical protein FQR65_LT05822 [Abscondita terminalis]|nr:hypothetical protein FQR65_LT05822 [Abscondita terminalis]